MPRVLVVLSTDSYRASDFIDAADSLSVELVIASEERPPLLPDDRFIQIDCANAEESARALANWASQAPIDAVVAAEDAGVEIAARAGEALGLRASPPAAAAATLDKAMARRLLAAAEVPQPEFRLLGPDTDPESVVASLGGPVVIKPIMLSAGRGVLRVDSPGEARRAVERIRGIVAAAGRDRDLPLLVERYVPGFEISVEGIVWGGEVEILAVFDKPVPMTGPAFEETIFVTPSRLGPEVLAEVERVTGKAVAALGLTEGPIHAELRIEDGRPLVIEIAARSIGGLCGRSLRFGLLGSPLETLILRHALGMPKRSLRREAQAAGVAMIPVPRSGTLTGVNGLELVRDLPSVTDVEISVRVGRSVAPPPDGDRYLGFVFSRAAEPATVERDLRTALELVDVEVE